jgi:F-type H+-transporting ATPase subunit a
MIRSILAAREGFHAPDANVFYQKPLIDLEVFGIDVSINRTVLIVILGTTIVAGLFLAGSRKDSIVPRGLQNVVEAMIDFVKNQIVLPVMGSQGLHFLPYLTTLFFFIFAMNIFEVIPGVNFPATSRFGIPIALAFFSWVLYVQQGIKHQGAVRYFKDIAFPPGVPWYMMFLLTPIEIISTLIVRPCTLAVRLVANMIAGHLMLAVFFLGTAYLFGRGLTFGFGILAFAMSVALVGFEIFVAGLQAFIFTILTAVYLAGSREPAH